MQAMPMYTGPTSLGCAHCGEKVTLVNSLLGAVWVHADGLRSCRRILTTTSTTSVPPRLPKVA